MAGFQVASVVCPEAPGPISNFTPVRQSSRGRVAAIKQLIARNEYTTPDKVDLAIDRLMKDLEKIQG